MKLFNIFLITLFIQTGCTQSIIHKYKCSEHNIIYSGRFEKLSDEVVLIGSATSATMYFTGDTCTLFLRNHNNNNLYNYYSVELDDEDLGKFKIEGDSMIALSIPITFPKEFHKVSVYKSTEAANGYINFGGILCEKLLKPIAQPKLNIEFIGNSITCGMGNDTLEIPCHTNQWYDQHNAYWAYGPTVSRALKVNYLLSSVSGIGMYRNWNGVGPIMPEVYENLYLNLDTKRKRNFSKFKPNIVSICLGTNDLSKGDGVNERLPFDELKFTENYIQFVNSILEFYPETQIALLNSPMVLNEENEVLLNCLTKVKKHFESTSYKPFAIFEFDKIIPHGCDFHPDINDHMMMAEQLYHFYKNLLEE